MNTLIIYIHGKGGSSSEAEHYKKIFGNCTVVGFDYKAETPWEAKPEFSDFFDKTALGFDRVFLIANSIGAYFSLCSLNGKKIEKAFFISPIVDMEKLICDMMSADGISEDELKEKGQIRSSFGEILSYDYLLRVRTDKPEWNIPTAVLYGSKDNMQSFEVLESFAEKSGASLTVFENGEHWFHTDEQMKFLDSWIKKELR